MPSPSGDGSSPEEKNGKSLKKFDFSKLKPEDFPCFGTIDPEHDECKACPFKDKCAEKAGLA